MSARSEILQYSCSLTRICHYATKINQEYENIIKDPRFKKQLTSGSGVRETSRLISRFRHRQFGMFTTTSYISEQAYKENIEDGHPVIVVAAVDIVKILIASGYATIETLLHHQLRDYLITYKEKVDRRTAYRFQMG